MRMDAAWGSRGVQAGGAATGVAGVRSCERQQSLGADRPMQDLVEDGARDATFMRDAGRRTTNQSYVQSSSRVSTPSARPTDSLTFGSNCFHLMKEQVAIGRPEHSLMISAFVSLTRYRHVYIPWPKWEKPVCSTRSSAETTTTPSTRSWISAGQTYLP